MVVSDVPIDTFSELKTSIADFLNRADLTAVIPSFIALAEADINRQVRDWRMEKRVIGDIDTRFSSIPTDWVETMRFHLTGGGTSALTLISHAALLEEKERAEDAGGRPRYYAMTGAQFEFFPVPDGTYPSELVYLGKIPALSDAAPTNWLLTNYPDVYLYGSLAHSAPYLKEDERVTIWANLYQSAVDSLNQASDAARYSGRGLKMKTRGY